MLYTNCIYCKHPIYLEDFDIEVHGVAFFCTRELCINIHNDNASTVYVV